MEWIGFPAYVTVLENDGIYASSRYKLINNMVAKIDAFNICVYENGKVYFSVEFKKAAEYLMKEKLRGYTFAYKYHTSKGEDQYVPLKWSVLKFDDNGSKYDYENMCVIFYEEGTYDVENPDSITQTI